MADQHINDLVSKDERQRVLNTVDVNTQYSCMYTSIGCMFTTLSNCYDSPLGGAVFGVAGLGFCVAALYYATSARSVLKALKTAQRS